MAVRVCTLDRRVDVEMGLVSYRSCQERAHNERRSMGVVKVMVWAEPAMDGQ